MVSLIVSLSDRCSGDVRLWKSTRKLLLQPFLRAPTSWGAGFVRVQGSCGGCHHLVAGVRVLSFGFQVAFADHLVGGIQWVDLSVV